MGRDKLPSSALPRFEEQTRSSSHAFQGASHLSLLHFAHPSLCLCKMIITTFRKRSSLAARRASKKMTIKDPNSSDDEIVEINPGIDDDVHGWAYVGSANLTPSAWGT